MGRHRKPRRRLALVLAPAPGDRAGRQLAAGIVGVSAVAATLLSVLVDPAAPPSPDRAPVSVPGPQAAP
ncbi:hypothetical protein [Streptomyces sp. KR80]|uniref:hypothetical protein n=1 Tax=Streptomyces sp. KR80 TaxID=3457426 RepID=UPI003FCFAC8B